MNVGINRDIKTFLDGEVNNLIDKIDISYTELLPKKSEIFVQRFLKDSKGNLVVNEPVHNIMHRFIRLSRSKGYNKFMVLGAFGHGKTEQLCTGFVLHEIAKNTNILVKLVHVSDDEAVKRCRAIRDYILKDLSLNVLL